MARRYLASQQKGRFLSLITVIAMGGVFVGVMALITVVAVMTGLQRDLQAKILGSNPHIHVFEAGRGGFRLHDWRAVHERIAEVPGVIGAEPYVMAQVGVTESGEFAQPGVVYGIVPGTSAVPLTQIDREIREGVYAFGPTLSQHPGMLMGRRLADRLGVLPGDLVTVGSFENLRMDAFGIPQPAMMQFEITGIFQTGMYEYDLQNMYADLRPVQQLLDMQGETVSAIAVNVQDPWAAPQTARALSEALGMQYFTHDWTTVNAPLFSALKLEKLALTVILFLIVLVAAFNIISTLVMVVADKTREIGILKSMGMTSQTVMRIFMLQGLSIGLIGTILGALGGWGLIRIIDRTNIIEIPAEVYFLDSLPVALELSDLLIILAGSVLLAFLATIYPAWHASRLLPVEAIRHD
jgi:lipoprotein-releasing system permease protein